MMNSDNYLERIKKALKLSKDCELEHGDEFRVSDIEYLLDRTEEAAVLINDFCVFQKDFLALLCRLEAAEAVLGDAIADGTIHPDELLVRAWRKSKGDKEL